MEGNFWKDEILVVENSNSVFRAKISLAKGLHLEPPGKHRNTMNCQTIEFTQWILSLFTSILKDENQNIICYFSLRVCFWHWPFCYLLFCCVFRYSYSYFIKCYCIVIDPILFFGTSWCVLVLVLNNLSVNSAYKKPFYFINAFVRAFFCSSRPLKAIWNEYVPKYLQTFIFVLVSKKGV